LQKKLLIYETTHVENLSALLVLSEGYFSEVTIFIPASSCRQLQYILNPLHLSLKINWITREEEQNRPFIRRFFRHIRESSYTHLHIGTLEHNMFLFAWHLRRCRHLQISMTLHSINEYSSSLYTDIRNISETVAKRILYRKVHHYRVLAPAMAGTFKKFFPKKQVCFIPGNFNRPPDEHKLSQNTFSIVIPGTVEHKRRDYQMVIRFLNMHAKELTAFTPVHIVLAGNAGSSYGKEITQALQQLSVKHTFRLSYFIHPLEQHEYEALYNQADIIWAPVILHTNSLRGIAEINGVTHSPGFITDQIYFGKPAIIPKGLQLPLQFAGCNWEYENENDLLSIFTSILSNKSALMEANHKISIACSYFRTENFTGAFNDLLAAD
jgi:hypothetical protein